MFDILSKLGDFKKKMDEIKARLETIIIDEKSADGKISVSVTAGRKIRSIDINPELLDKEKAEEVQELLETVLNRALERAEAVSEMEMKSAGRDLLPGMPGI
jgi:nucleoid-associated protein EbfC